MTYLPFVVLFLFNVNAQQFPPLNLYIGSGGDFKGAANLPIGAQIPYGTVRVGPDTNDLEDGPTLINRYAGYHYSDTFINIFSHTHVFGAGIVDYGEVGIIPVQATDDTDLKRMISKKHGYRSEFRHETETIEPGYYQVYLDTHKIKVELTATEQVAIHRYTFDQSNENHQHVILIDSSYALPSQSHDGCKQSHVNIDPTTNQINGSILFDGNLSIVFGGLTTYFVIKFNNWTDFGVWTNDVLLHGQTTANGCSSGAFIILPSDQQQVTFYVGISFVSIEQAAVNLEIQTNLQSFDSLREFVQQKWLNELVRFKVDASWNRDGEIKFYTAIVHSMSSPTIWDESNGVYLGFDNKIHIKPNYMEHIYTDLSIWDIFRTQMPFLIFHDSKRANDIIQSIMLIVEQGGYLPKWPLANGYTNCMIGSHADIMISDLITKNEHDSYLNLTQVIQALRIVANTYQIHDSRFDPVTYIKYHYVPFDKDAHSASLTLSYAYDDWAIGNVMLAVGLKDEAQEYYQRSQWFENVFDHERKFFCPRNSTGTILCPEIEAEYLFPYDYRYTEGDAWHYRFYVPHNTTRLVQLFDSPANFAEQLNIFFMRSRDWPTTTFPNPYYWAGNEHDLFCVWQFHYANRSDLTQLHSRWLLDHVYTTKPDGIPGNDDYGTMSAWYIFTSMGFYPLAGSSTYLIGSPAFDHITIHRNHGQCTLEIFVHDNSPSNVYVKYVLLNNKTLSTFPFIDHIRDLQCSTEISTIQFDFFMSSTPSSLLS